MRYIALVIAMAGVMSPIAQSLPTVQLNLATIVNSGSTNSAGFRIDVRRSGMAVYTRVPRGANAAHEEPEKSDREIPKDLASRLFADLDRRRERRHRRERQRQRERRDEPSSIHEKLFLCLS